MATVVKPYLDRISTIEQELEYIGGQIIIDFKEDILNLVKNKQLGIGLDSKGNPLIHPSKRSGGKREGKRIGVYEFTTESYFAKLNPPIKPKSYTEPYNFQWSGGTFDGMFVDVGNENTFTIFSKDFKAKILESEYKTQLFDLTNEHNTWVNENIILPNLQKYMLDNIFA